MAKEGEGGFAHKVQHNLTQQHVLERAEGLAVLVVALRGEVFEGLKEVRVSGGVVFVLGVQDAALEVECGLESRWAVDGVGSRPRGGESGLYANWSVAVLRSWRERPKGGGFSPSPWPCCRCRDIRGSRGGALL